MERIRVELADNAYPVYLGRGLLTAPDAWRSHLGDGKVLVVTNDRVGPLYLDSVCSALQGMDVRTHVLPDGEQHKTVATWNGILDRLVGIEARRDATVVALGGGVVGDIAGFAAASYMRGIRFVQLPTTLLAQVDASVGGKTGVNHPRGKNLVGAFHQPAAVIIDSATLDTLPAREFRAGMAEVVKYGAIRDSAFFDWLEANRERVLARDEEAIDYLIRRSVENKAQVVAADEREAGVRALLNLGHTFGHALESETAYRRFLHGEAVAIGTVVAAALSEARGLCPAGLVQRVEALLRGFGLPVRIPADLSAERLLTALQLDKKALAGGLRLILLASIGEAVIDAGSREPDILAALESCRQAT